MTTTTNYGLNIVEGTDIVNPLTQFNPNFNDIDSIMKANADAAVSPATCIKTGTVHTVTRANTGSEMFVFTATGDWNLGDSMTVDGLSVTPVLPDGTGLIAGSFLINAEVLASIKGTKVTIYSNKYNIGADIVDNLTSTSTDKALSANQGKVLDDKMALISTGTITSSRSEVTVTNYDVNKQGHIVTFTCSITTNAAITDRNPVIKLPYRVIGGFSATIISNANTIGTLYGSSNTDTLVRDIGSIPAASFSIFGTYATND